MNRRALQGWIVVGALVAVGSWNIYHGVDIQRGVGVLLVLAGIIVFGATSLDT